MNDFEYAAPATETETLALMAERPDDTELLAGGTDLVGLMKKLIVAPGRVVNIDGVASMRTIERDPAGNTIIGAVVHLDDLLDHPYSGAYPAVMHAIRGINSPQLQAQGTLGGELLRRPRCWYFRAGHGLLAGGGRMVAEGDNRFHAILGNSGPAKFVSASRIAPALVALGARLRLIGPAPGEETTIFAEDLFQSPRRENQRENTLLPGQVLAHIVLPPVEGIVSATYEVRHGEGPDAPLAAAAACLHISGGIVRRARIVLGQVAPVPWISDAAAAALIGRAVGTAEAEEAGKRAVARATPLSMNAYKVSLTQTAVKRAVLRAIGRPTGGFDD
jgi:xanthine dehydrogenase YagS FAD-binding subunit